MALGMTSERAFTIAFGISLTCHVLFLGVQFVRLAPFQSLKKSPRPALDVIYEYQIAEQETRRLKERLASLKELPELQAPQPQIRIPERPLAAGSASVGGSGYQGDRSQLIPGLSAGPSDVNAVRAAVVDLTNLVDAAQGNPVLLSYFSAIREQIQRTANRNTWLTGGATGGLVYISFVLGADGQVQAASILADRSVPAQHLQDIAVRIVKASSPFPPFPPSLGEPAKTIVVPLEFMVGGS